jgi:DNA-binding MarR family transcriptional regulator
MKQDYILISFIMRAKRRKAVLECLKENPKIPKDIATECKISISNVSNTLPELVKKNLVKCKNPKDHYFRYYEITKKGKDLIKSLNI